MVTYPEDWKCDTITNIADITTGCRDTQDNKVNGRYPFFVRSPIVERIDVADFDCEAVLTAGDGVGTGKVFHYINGKFAAHQRVYVMSSFQDVDGKYFYYYFSNNFGKEVEKYTAKSSVDSVRRDMIAEMELPHPPLPEQKEIVQALLDFDEHIDNLTELIEKKKAIRDGALEELLSGRTRLDGFDGEWEEVELGNIISSLKSGLSRELRNYDVGLPVVRANNINDGKLNLNDDVKYWYKDDPKGADTSQYLIKKDDILVNFINSEAKMGTSAIVLRDCSRDTIYTTNILRMRVKDNFCSKFLFYITFTNLYKKYIIDISKIAVNQASFTTVDYKQFKFRAPIDTEEQQAIASVITAMDEEIESLEMEKAKMMGIREGAMDDLLTGRVRLKV